MTTLPEPHRVTTTAPSTETAFAYRYVMATHDARPPRTFLWATWKEVIPDERQPGARPFRVLGHYDLEYEEALADLQARAERDGLTVLTGQGGEEPGGKESP